jgi:hypothetical protein
MLFSFIILAFSLSNSEELMKEIPGPRLSDRRRGFIFCPRVAIKRFGLSDLVKKRKDPGPG